jgi:single-strand DNA-binding protein
MQPLALGAVSSPPLGAPRKWGKKGETNMYLNHVQLIGFLGRDPEKKQVRGNGANFTVLSVATQQSWKDSKDEWQSKTEWHRVVAFNRLGEALAESLHKGDHVLVDGLLVSSKYEGENGKSKNTKAAQFSAFWSIRANSVSRLSRAEADATTAAPSAEPGAEAGGAPF